MANKIFSRAGRLSSRIPNRIFTFFNLGTKDEPIETFYFWQYLCLHSMQKINNPDNLTLLGRVEPVGEWWERARPFVKFEFIEPVTSIFGCPLPRRTYRADVMRLQRLIEQGGIYFDMDTICIKPITSLLNHQAIMGREFSNGLCNAVILSLPKNPFLREWLEEFHSFKSGLSHAVFTPWTVSRRAYLAKYLTILPRTTFFDPFWDAKGIELMHDRNTIFPEAYSHHLWYQMTYKRLNNYTVESILSGKSTFCRIARAFL